MLYEKYFRSGKNAKEFKLLRKKIVRLTNDSRDRLMTLTYPPKYYNDLQYRSVF